MFMILAYFLLYNITKITPTLAASYNPARHSFMTFDEDSVVSATRRFIRLTAIFPSIFDASK